MPHNHKFQHHHVVRAQVEEMNKHNIVEARDLEKRSSTLMSVIYVTASPTFTGAIGGYVTLTPGTTTTSYDAFKTITGLVGAGTTDQQSSTIISSPVVSTIMTSSVVSSSSAAMGSSLPSTTFLTPSFQNTQSPSNTVTAAPQASTSSTAQLSTNSQSSGMSGGAAAGIAIGLISLLTLAAAGVFFMIRKRKQARSDFNQIENEKSTFGAAGASSGASKPTSQINTKPIDSPRSEVAAPTLSLRPMSQIRFSQSNPMETANKPAAMVGAGTGRVLTTPVAGASVENQRTSKAQDSSNPFNDHANPFADHANTASVPNLTVTPPAGEPEKPAAINAGVPLSGELGAKGPTATLAGGAFVAAETAQRGHSRNTGSNASNASAAANTGPAGAAGFPPSNVHRVQIDFKPSMTDELELQAGQLVRILHEYDDGWALCIRLDRSQQGVAPRTCLSPQPVKPRPANNGLRGPGPAPAQGLPRSPGPMPRGPPRFDANDRPMSPARGHPMTPTAGPGSRPMSPANGPGPRFGPLQSRPMTPTGDPRMGSPAPPRSASPALAPYNQSSRPLSPGPNAGPPRPQPKRSMSPGPYGGGAGPKPMVPKAQRRRTNSASAINVRDRRASPPGPSPLGSSFAPGLMIPAPDQMA